MEACVAGPTLGATIRTFDIPGLTLTEASFAPRSMLPWHSHERASLCMLTEGVATEEFRHARHVLHRHDVTYKPIGAPHSNSFGNEGARFLIVELAPEWLTGHQHAIQTALSKACVVSAADLGRRLHDEIRRYDALTPLALQSICLELLLRVARAWDGGESKPAPRWLRDARDLLHERCVQQLVMDDIARSVGVHPVYLAQAFKRHFGVTIGEYVRRLRVHHGARALLTTTRPIADIAVECGFCDQSHFNRVFKRVTSISPARYRLQEQPLGLGDQCIVVPPTVATRTPRGLTNAATARGASQPATAAR